MGFNRSYLTCLSVLGVLLLGGCSWVADLEWPQTSEAPPNETISGESVNAQDPAIATPSSSEDPSIASDPTAAADINHGERLSTLNDGELPPGRLPPDIVPATGDVQRLPQIEPGRRDPFASLPVRPFLVQRQPVASSSIASTPIPATPSVPASVPTAPATGQPATVPPSPQAVVPVPIATQLPSPPLAQRPVTPVPTVPVATTPVPERPTSVSSESVSVASATPPSFEFSGVVQVGDRVNIIVEEPSGSRYVQVGERVGNGQFVIKAVDFNQGSTPAVILERGGAESVHWVGSPIAM